MENYSTIQNENFYKYASRRTNKEVTTAISSTPSFYYEKQIKPRTCAFLRFMMSDFMSSDNFNSKILTPSVEDENETVQNISPTTPDTHAKNVFLTKAEYSPELFSSSVKGKTKRCLIFDFDEFSSSEDIENFDLHSNLELQAASSAYLNEIQCTPDKVSTSHEKYALKSVSVHPLLSSSFDSVPANEANVPYKYINEPVKSKQERKKLHGHSCHCCRNYVDKLYLDDEEKAKRLNEVGRHRALHPRPKSPEHFWDVGFPSTPEIEERSLIYRDIDLWHV
ncbi:DNA endonuclease RBBP8 [Trichinella nativa]|uniref:DNA endonuclease RBBP8 n=1 Tax=Trichinella nativa TaxID=6335 RepID=A0A0V1LP86_9BILA|nr:DNA endonuclease RBBP8 [Trichinella nativa]